MSENSGEATGRQALIPRASTAVQVRRKKRLQGRGVHSLEYCLFCYAPMATTCGASQRCARCGRVHLRIDHSTHWSREPKLVCIEWSIKGVIASLIIAWFVYLSMNHELGPVSTFLIGPMLMLGGVLWWTAGLITRKPRYFSGRVLWTSSILMLAFGTPVLLFIMDVVARRSTFGSEYWKAYLILASPVLPMIVIAGLLLLFAKSFDRFKERRLAGLVG